MTVLAKWARRQKFLLTVLVLCLLWGPLQNGVAHVTNTRTYRDMTMSTPFHSVELTAVDFTTDPPSLIVQGTFIKRRCFFSELTAYVYDGGGLGHFVAVDTHIEGRPSPQGNSPSSKKVQTWGPWRITLPPIAYEAVTFEIWARHKCPESPDVEENLFLTGVWDPVAE